MSNRSYVVILKCFDRDTINVYNLTRFAIGMGGWTGKDLLIQVELHVSPVCPSDLYP